MSIHNERVTGTLFFNIATLSFEAFVIACDNVVHPGCIESMSLLSRLVMVARCISLSQMKQYPEKCSFKKGNR
jgi:hypothetical protein